MKHLVIDYKGYKITKRVDEPSNVCIIFKGSDMVKCIAGDVNLDNEENSINKSKRYIDVLEESDSLVSNLI